MGANFAASIINTAMSKTIFITGASRGLGKIWAEAFLKRGDKVVTTSRTLSSLQELADRYPDTCLPIQLDISSKADSIAAIEKAIQHFGSLDVLINNAGFAVLGTIEEISEKDIRDIFEANFYGTVFTTQAILPHFRKQGSGHIIQLSSALGINTAPTMGIYSATKFAVEAFSEALQAEVKEFGINVTLLEPNGFATDFGTNTLVSQVLPAYDAVKAELKARFTDDDYGVPEATVDAVLQLIDSDNPPLHFFLGNRALPWTQYNYAQKLAEWEEWKDVSAAAHGK